MQRSGIAAVLEPELVQLLVLVFEGLPRRRHLRDPGRTLFARQGVGQGLEKNLLVAHDAQVERPITPEIFLLRMDPDGLHVRVEAVLTGARHAVLPDENDEVRTHQRVRRGIRGEAVVVAEMSTAGTRLDHD